MSFKPDYKINWISIKNKKPNHNEQVFVLGHSQGDSDPDDIHDPTIFIAVWSDYCQDFTDVNDQLCFSDYWIPIPKP